MNDTIGTLTIGQLATAVGKTPRALRLYEEMGLLVPSRRSQGGFRLYGADAVARLRWVIELADAGLPLAEIQDLLVDIAAADDGGGAMNVLRTRLAARRRDLTAQVRQLQALGSGIDAALGYLERCRDCHRAPLPLCCKQCVEEVGQDLPDMVAGLLAQRPLDQPDTASGRSHRDAERSHT